MLKALPRCVTLADIGGNDYNLNITRYVERKSEEKVLSVEEAMDRLRESANSAFEAEQKLISVLKQNGILVSD